MLLCPPGICASGITEPGIQLGLAARWRRTLIRLLHTVLHHRRVPERLSSTNIQLQLGFAHTLIVLRSAIKRPADVAISAMTTSHIGPSRR